MSLRLLAVAFLCVFLLGTGSRVLADSEPTFTSATPVSRIIGGQNATELYPWMVSIQRRGHFCGGVLIGKDWVLTAAHCMEDADPADLTLIIGTSNLATLSNAELRGVSWYVVHPDYDDHRYFSDIAILKLKSSSNKPPLPIIDALSNSNLQKNEQMRVLGWGLTEEGNLNSTSYSLNEVDVSFQPDSDCKSVYGSLGRSDYWTRSFCAGEDSGGKDACQGDSGGPILVKANGEWALAGLVSWGSGCGEAGHYGAYSEVAAFQDWIEQRRRGVTLFGSEKIGFLGAGRQKAETYTIMNLNESPAKILSKTLDQSPYEPFSIDGNNWLIGDEIPAGYQCEFVVNAVGSQVGEQFADMHIETDKGSVTLALNAKVLRQIDGQALDVQWPFFSGTQQFTEHSASWDNALESVAQGGSVLKSGAIGDDQRSVLLTYLQGAEQNSPYLKFDARVSSAVKAGSVDSLLLFINESLLNPSGLMYAGGDNQWASYAVPLVKQDNHVMFIYYKDGSVSEGEDAAYLDNLRVCSDPYSENSCTAADAWASFADFSLVDDPQPTDDWRSVCQPIDYSDSQIQYASRSQDDVVEGDISPRTGGGAILWLLGGLLGISMRRKVEENTKISIF